ncbi:MAG: hypothetical protein ACREPJ_01435 [Rhodanobacteraceae bacterium]
MNKRLLCTALLAICGTAALAMPAFAQNRADSTQTQPTAAAASNQAAPNQKTATSRDRDARKVSPLLGTRMCIRDTGSLIPAPKGQCLPVPGNSYSQKDIQRTGATNIGQALQMLDPSVTAGH